MRAIKFRVWDGEKFGYIEIGDGRISWPCSHRYMESFPSTHRNWNIPEHADGQVFVGQVEFQEFTGLKDKSGVEIYEGDILAIWGEWEDGERGGIGIIGQTPPVSFESAAFVILDEGNWTEPIPIHDWQQEMPDCQLEVIGNQFENPELLEVAASP